MKNRENKKNPGFRTQNPEPRTPNPEFVIKVENLTKVYHLYNSPKDRLKEALNPFKKSYHHDFYALDNINFEINRGETVGIIGKNGAGKSTLLKIITGVLTPSSGNVEVKGKIASLLELGAGFNPEMTGLENIYLNGTLMGFTKEEMDKKIDTILEFADIGEFIHQSVKMYSSGMFARLAFSVAINVEPDILIVDEALSVGDINFQLKCMDKFDELRKGGRTILFVSHDINAVKRFCSSAIWLNNGKVEALGNTNRVTDKYLDFLKYCSLDNSSNDTPTNTQIAEILDIKTYENGIETNELNFANDIEVLIKYDVHNTDIQKPVIGVAVYTLNRQYICGINTLLDGVDIPWEKGENSIKLIYKKINLTGGSYYLDVALFEKNATITFDYKESLRKITINAPYIGEGICILEHKWEQADEV